jgi:hypothetical protein
MIQTIRHPHGPVQQAKADSIAGITVGRIPAALGYQTDGDGDELNRRHEPG